MRRNVNRNVFNDRKNVSATPAQLLPSTTARFERGMFHVQCIWRAAYFSPLPKQKPPEHIKTDRPISLTAVLCNEMKEMEEFVVKWVWDSAQELT